MPRLDYLWYELDAQTKGFDEGILKSGEKLKNFTEYAKGAPLVVLGAIGAAAIVAGVKIAKMGADFEYAMARVNTAAQLPKESLDALGKGVLKLSAETGTGLADLTRGLYDIVSSGIPAGQALDVLTVAAKGAVGGVTNVAIVVDALTSILNAYRDQNLDVAKVQDQLFEAVNKGKVTYEELAGSIGQVVGIAATMGIQLDDLLGVITQLSLQGIKTSEAITGVRAAIENIIKPSQQFAQLFPELAAQFNEGRLRGEGFTKFLLDLEVAAKGNNQVFATLFGSVEAYKTVLAALQHEGRDTAAMQRDIATATGAADDATQKMSNTAIQAEARLKATLSAELTRLGSSVLPAYNAALEIAIGLTNLLGGKSASAMHEAVENMHAFERSVLDSDKTLSGNEFNDFSRLLGGFIRDVKLGALDIKSFRDEELTTLNRALDVTAQRYQNLGDVIKPVTQAIREQLDARAKQRAQDETATAQRRQSTAAAVGFDVAQGTQSARDILTPPTQSQTYLTALRQIDAITKAIKQSEGELAKASDDAQQALESGDDALLADAKKRADAARASIEAQRATMRDALNTQYQYELRLQQQVNAVVSTVAEATAKATHSAADDLRAEIAKIDEQVTHVRARGGVIDQASVDRVHTLYNGMIEVAEQADLTKKVLESSAHADQTRGTPEDFEAIAARLLQLHIELNGLDSTALGYADRRRDLESQIAELEKRKADLTERNLKNYKAVVDELARIRNEQSRLIREQAGAIDSLIKAGISLGEAFGIVNDKTGQLLTNLATVGTNLKPFLDELDKFNSNEKDSKGNPLATFGSVVSAALPVIGGITSILGAAFGGGNSAAEAQRRQIIEQNTDAILSLTRQIGEFGSVNVSGSTFSKAGQAVDAFLATLLNHPTSDQIRHQNDVLAADLAKLGLTMGDLDAIAQSLGITLQHDGNLAEDIVQLQKAMQQAQITQFAQTFTGQLDALNAEFQLFDITDPIKQLQKLVTLFDDPKFGAPALREALAGLDLTTPEGRAQAQAAIQALFQQLQAGTLTPDQLGGLTPQQFLDAIEQTKKLLDQANGGGPNGTGGYNVSREITETSAGALIAQATTANVWLQRITTASEATAAALRGTSLGALPVLTPPLFSNSASAASSAGVVVNLTMNVVIQPGQSISDAMSGAQQAAPALAAEVSKRLANGLLRRDRINGTTLIRR